MRVGGSDHDIVIRALVQDGGLSGEDDVGIEGLVRGGGPSLFAGFGPEVCGQPHDLRGNGQVTEVPGELVEPAQAPGLAGPQEFPADLVIGDLWHEHWYARGEQGPQPQSGFPVGLEARMGYEPERPCVEQDGPSQRA